jgi:hypothetical protein
MSSVGFVAVMGALEPDAIAGHIASNAHRRVGQLVALVDDWLAEQNNALNQKQKVELSSTALRLMDGFEQEVIDTLVEECDRIRIRETGGDDAR